MKAGITVVNGITVEFQSPVRNKEFVSEVARNLCGKWNRKGYWTFDGAHVDALKAAAEKYFGGYELREIIRPILDRKSENRRKIIMGAMVMSRAERGDTELLELLREMVADMKPADRVLFGYLFD